MTLYVDDGDFQLYVGDALEVLRGLPDESVHCALTSPPFYGLRDYGTGSWVGGDEGCDHSSAKVKTRFDYDLADKQASNAGSDVTRYRDACECGARRVDQQIGLEATPEEWVARLVGVFREVRRVLRSDGTLWVECGDSYASSMTSDRRMHQPTGPNGTPATGRASVATGQRTCARSAVGRDGCRSDAGE